MRAGKRDGGARVGRYGVQLVVVAGVALMITEPKPKLINPGRYGVRLVMVAGVALMITEPKPTTRNLGRYGVRLVVVAGVALMITEQYLQPTIANSLVPLRRLNWPHMIERVLKLSLPTLYGWLLIFYALFHLWRAPGLSPCRACRAFCRHNFASHHLQYAHAEHAWRYGVLVCPASTRGPIYGASSI